MTEIETYCHSSPYSRSAPSSPCVPVQGCYYRYYSLSELFSGVCSAFGWSLDCANRRAEVRHTGHYPSEALLALLPPWLSRSLLTVKRSHHHPRSEARLGGELTDSTAVRLVWVKRGSGSGVHIDLGLALSASGSVTVRVE